MLAVGRVGAEHAGAGARPASTSVGFDWPGTVWTVAGAAPRPE